MNIQMETLLLELDITYEHDDEDATRHTARMAHIEKTVQEIAAREEEVDKLQVEWTEGHANQAKQHDT